MNNEKMNQLLAKIGMQIIIKYKYLFAVLVLIVMVISYWGTERIITDSSNESFFLNNDATIIENDQFKELFGNEEFIFILIEPKNETEDVFQYETLKYIRRLSQDLKENLPFAKDTVCLTDIEYTETIEDELIIDDLIGEDIPATASQLEEIKQKALSKKIYIDRIITPDGKKTGIAISFEPIPDAVYLPVAKNFNPIDQEKWPPQDIIMQDKIFLEKKQANYFLFSDPRKLIAPALKTIIKRNPASNLKITYTGLPYMDYESDKIIVEEGSAIGLIALIAAVLLLLIIFKNPLAVIAPFLVIVSTIMILFGALGWLKIPVNMTTIVIAPLILVISVSYSIHVINHFQHCFRENGRTLDSLKYAFEHSAWPCLITALTTALGFASFIVVPIKPIRNMGIICSAGVFLTYLLTFLIMPIFYSFKRNQKKPKTARLNRKNQTSFSIQWADFVIKKPILTMVLFIIVITTLFFYIFRVRFDSEMTNMLGPKVPFSRDADYVASNLGGVYSFEVLVYLPEQDMGKNPAVLKSLEHLQQNISQWDQVKTTMSLVDVVKDINLAMNQNQDQFNRIPDSKNLIAQYLLLYEISDGEAIDDWVDYQFKILRLSVQSATFSTQMTDRFEELIQYSESRFPDGTKISITGDLPILLKMLSLLASGQVQSIIVAFIVITILMMIILRSFKLGLLSMLPNVFPVIVILGLMGLLNIPIDLMTIMIAPMIIGIAVDDTVHYFVHFRQEFEKIGHYQKSNRETFVKVGKAILFTSVILILGFSVFVFSNLKSLTSLAILSSAGILAALLGDLFVTPVLFVYLKPFGKENQKITE